LFIVGRLFGRRRLRDALRSRSDVSTGVRSMRNISKPILLFALAAAVVALAAVSILPMWVR